MSSYLARLKTLLFYNDERGTWPRRFDFLVTATTYTVGIKMVHYLPASQHTYGGAAFLIPYLFFMLVIGVPLTFIEISLGQFTSRGPMKCWKFAPAIQGIGVVMVVLSIIVSVMRSHTCTVIVYYFFASLASPLPWSECDAEWRTKPCTMKKVSSASDCNKHGWTSSDDGGCYDDDYELVAIWGNSTVPRHHRTYLATTDYYFRHVMQRTTNYEFGELGPVVWHLALCSLFVWIIVALSLSKSVKTYGTVAYITTICPCALLLLLFVNGLVQDGHVEGYRFYSSPNYDVLKEYRVWLAAGTQVLYTLSLSFGGLITLSSYNSFKTDTIRNTVALCLINVVAMVICGPMVFFYIGALAKHRGVTIGSLVHTTYVHSVMPEAFLTTGAPTLWSIIWFLMLMFLSIGPLLGYVETVMTGIFDVFPRIRRYRPMVVAAVCFGFYLVGLHMMTPGGSVILSLLTSRTTYLGMFVLPVIEMVALTIYGVPRFLDDVEMMIGEKTCWFIPIRIGKFVMCFFLFLPTLAAVSFLASVATIEKGDEFRYWRRYAPKWILHTSLFIYWTTVLIIIGGVLWSVFQVRRKLKKDWFAFLFPAPEWGPAPQEHGSAVSRENQIQATEV